MQVEPGRSAAPRRKAWYWLAGSAAKNLPEIDGQGDSRALLAATLGQAFPTRQSRILVESAGAAGLRQQAIAARLGHQELGVSRIALDLLAQAIDVGFERVRRDPGIVAPDLAEQGGA